MRGTRNIISSEARTSLPPTAQMNDVEALPQMRLPSANDVGLRPMKLRFAQTELSRSRGALKFLMDFVKANRSKIHILQGEIWRKTRKLLAEGRMSSALFGYLF